MTRHDALIFRALLYLAAIAALGVTIRIWWLLLLDLRFATCTFG